MNYPPLQGHVQSAPNMYQTPVLGPVYQPPNPGNQTPFMHQDQGRSSLSYLYPVQQVILQCDRSIQYETNCWKDANQKLQRELSTARAEKEKFERELCNVVRMAEGEREKQRGFLNTIRTLEGEKQYLERELRKWREKHRILNETDHSSTVMSSVSEDVLRIVT
jgi:hypothetical protein